MKNKNDNRRKLLKSIAAGSGAVVAGKSLPESWSKPVVDAVLLPAHAETTDESGSSGQGATTTPAATPTPTSTEPPCCLKDSGFCTKIGSPQSETRGSINIEISAGGSVQVGVYIGERTRYEGTGSIPCFGGEFSIRVDYVAIQMARKEDSGEIAFAPGSLMVTGTVICGQTTVSGTITGLQEPHNYTATPCF